MEQSKMQFILAGFKEVLGCRTFAFEGVATDRSRTEFTVSIDLALTRRYSIRLQELPLLCRAVLERTHEDASQRAFTYTEEDMCRYAAIATARTEEARRRKPPRRPSPGRAPGAPTVGPVVTASDQIIY